MPFELFTLRSDWSLPENENQINTGHNFNFSHRSLHTVKTQNVNKMRDVYEITNVCEKNNSAVKRHPQSKVRVNVALHNSLGFISVNTFQS